MSSVADTHDHQAERTDVARFGFWLYILSDVMLFGAFFATYFVLRGNTADAPAAHQLFELPFVLLQTLLLVFSSLTCALALLAYRHKRHAVGYMYLLATFVLGACFLGLELYEFVKLVHEGASWTASAFLSSYFGIVGLHGAHIVVGLLWLAVMLYLLKKRPVGAASMRRLTLFGIFWHFLDIVWIGVATIVYLIGVGVHG